MKKTIVTYTCDRHPNEPATDSLTMTWQRDGRTSTPHEIDLCAQCVKQFEWLRDHARPVRRVEQLKLVKDRPARRDPAETAAIRAWGREHFGTALSNRGRIPAEVEAAYRAAVGS